jgi:hypothetical protein
VDIPDSLQICQRLQDIFDRLQICGCGHSWQLTNLSLVLTAPI